jgi:hypothetical protein
LQTKQLELVLFNDDCIYAKEFMIMKARILLPFTLMFFVIGMARLISNGAAEAPQKEEPTPVQLGVMTPKQREHSRLYKRYDTGRKITKLLQTEKGDVWLSRLSPLGADLLNGVLPTVADEVKRITCSADVVVLGIVKSKLSQITEDDSFVFTDYEILVQETLKDSNPSPIQPNQEITVTRPGGTVSVKGRIVTALDESFQPLKIENQYVLFLRSVSGSDAYSSIESGESFEIHKDQIKSLGKEPLSRLTLEYNPTSFINEVRAAATPCSRNKGGGK